jgi:acylphosphatase
MGIIKSAVVAMAVLLLAGCGQNPPPAARAVPPAPPAQSAPAPPAAVPPAPPAPGPEAAPATPPAKVEKMRRVRALVSGRVQGVGFRNFTSVKAHALGVTGWVRNLKDGRVEAVVEGPDGKVGELIEALKTGPSGSRVDGVEIEEQTYRGEFGSFKIVL